MHRVKLRAIAHARAGDKGDTSNLALIVFDRRHYAAVARQVTPDRVRAWFSPLVRGRVERFELPELGALNFVLYQALGGGVTRSVNLDPHGKSRSARLLEMEVEVDQLPAASTPSSSHSGGGP
jgi:hypothetical protein